MEVEQTWRWGTDCSANGKPVEQQSQVDGLFVEGG